MSSQRIRTIKPDFWTDEKIVELPFEARLLFIGLWNLADDEGFFWDEPGRIKFQLFPADDVDVSYLFGLLVKQDFLEHYETDEGKGFFRLRNFVKHQTISHARQSKFRQLKGFPHNHINDEPTGHNSKPPTTSRRNRKPLSPSRTSSLEGEGEGEWKGKTLGTSPRVKESQNKILPNKTISRDASVDDVTTASSAVEISTSAWPKNLADVVAALRELNAPEAFYDLAFWQRTHTAYAEDPDVFYVDELRNYLLWWHDQPVSRRRKAMTRSFGTWLRKTKTDAIRRKERRGGN